MIARWNFCASGMAGPCGASLEKENGPPLGDEPVRPGRAMVAWGNKKTWRLQPWEKQAIADGLVRGERNKALAAEFGVHRNTVSYVRRAFKLEPKSTKKKPSGKRKRWLQRQRLIAERARRRVGNV